MRLSALRRVVRDKRKALNMRSIFNAYAVSGFYVGHAVYVRIPWRILAYYCDSVAACHVVLMAAMLSCSCNAYLLPVCTRVVFFQ